MPKLDEVNDSMSTAGQAPGINLDKEDYLAIAQAIPKYDRDSLLKRLHTIPNLRPEERKAQIESGYAAEARLDQKVGRAEIAIAQGLPQNERDSLLNRLYPTPRLRLRPEDLQAHIETHPRQLYREEPEPDRNADLEAWTNWRERQFYINLLKGRHLADVKAEENNIKVDDAEWLRAHEALLGAEALAILRAKAETAQLLSKVRRAP